MTFVLGLTGSIGTGKSTVSRLFKRLQIPVHDSDAEVRDIYDHDQVFFKAVQETYPHYIKNHQIDRQALAGEAFQNDAILAWLQQQLHPRVRRRSEIFIAHHCHQQTPVIVLDIPLLFETGYPSLCNGILVTICRDALQKERVLKRPGMSVEKFEAILSHQWSQEKKRAGATWVVDTEEPVSNIFEKIKKILEECILE